MHRFRRRLSVSWSVHALCKFLEQYNMCFNLASNNNSENVSLPKGCGHEKTQVWCSQTLSQHSVVLENFLERGPVLND